MQQGGWVNKNNPSTPNGINVYTGASESTIAAEDGQKPGTFLKKINNELSARENITNNEQGGVYNVNNPSTSNATVPNGGSNIATGSS